MRQTDDRCDKLLRGLGALRIGGTEPLPGDPPEPELEPGVLQASDGGIYRKVPPGLRPPTLDEIGKTRKWIKKTMGDILKPW